MKNYIATAMALALVAGVAGLSAVPFAAAVHNDCHSNFNIADSEATASERELDPGEREVGFEAVFMATGDETLNVKLVDAGSSGELRWTVFHKPNGQCQQYEDGGCDENNVLRTESTVTCTLNAPGSGSEDYWVVYEEIGELNSIIYETWVS